MGGVVYKNDEFLLSLGYEGPDAYLRNGIPALETVRKANPKMLLFLLEWQRPEKWGKRRKIDVPTLDASRVARTARRGTDRVHRPQPRKSVKRRELHIYVLRRDGLRVPHASEDDKSERTSRAF
jgi:hypothetical protein